MTEMLEPCPLCGSTNVTCFAEYDGDNWENVPVYHAVAACLGCHEEGCNPDYDEEPCFGIEAYYTQDHPLIRDLEDPEDCERALERYMAKRWNHRAQRTFHVVEMRRGISQMQTMVSKKCSECGYVFGSTEVRPLFSGLDEMIEIGNVDIPNYCPSCGARVVREAGEYEVRSDEGEVRRFPQEIRERIVRCVDCKYSVFHPLSASTKMICELFDNQIMDRDDFCSRGKRYGDD